MKPLKIVLATSNKGKLTEIRGILAGTGAELFTLEDFPGINLPPEDEDAFAGNALEKARAVFTASGLPSLADDSGLEVDFLGGRPGVMSARYAGAGAGDKENCEKLVRELKGAPSDKRGARFVCAIAFITGSGECVFEGELKGTIAEAPRGQGGFGYDPLFIPLSGARTLAEMTKDEKNAISHRFLALKRFKEYILKAGAG